MINCQTGVRARVAFSVLARNGIEAKVIVEKFVEFKDNGINVVKVAWSHSDLSKLNINKYYLLL